MPIAEDYCCRTMAHAHTLVPLPYFAGERREPRRAPEYYTLVLHPTGTHSSGRTVCSTNDPSAYRNPDASLSELLKRLLNLDRPVRGSPPPPTPPTPPPPDERCQTTAGGNVE